MKLFRYGKAGREKPGVVIDGKLYDVSSLVADYDEEFFANSGIEYLRQITGESDFPEVRPERIGPPVHRPGKLICIGLNYRKHAIESGLNIPTEPVVFFKATSAICCPNDPVIIPRGSVKTDWEVELAFVIGKKANYVTTEEAMEYIAGFTMLNDVSERGFQLERGGQWVKGKSCDTFAPLGPYLVPAEEVKDPHQLNLWLKVNGEMMQDGNTSDFIFDIPTVVSYLSQFMSLMPGDIITTGTPEGVGLGHKPPKYLTPGDVMELGIEGLGEARQEVKAYQA